MFITNRALSRRTILRGMGATLALPFLDAMVPVFRPAAAAAPVRRFGAVFVPLGERPGFWDPTTLGANFELNAIPKRTLAENVNNGVTVDQVIADQIGQDTPMRSLELATEDFTGWIGGCDPSYSCAYMNTISWKNATTPMPMEINPRSVFERMFGRPGTSAQRRARMATDRSVLDSLVDELNGLRSGLGGNDLNRLNAYTENVREIEQRIQKAEKQSLTNVEVPDAPVGIPEEFEDHAALMYDLMALAYEADLTRVVTYMKSRDASQRVY